VPQDALQIINFLNRPISTSEGECSGNSCPEWSIAAVDLAIFARADDGRAGTAPTLLNQATESLRRGRAVNLPFVARSATVITPPAGIGRFIPISRRFDDAVESVLDDIVEDVASAHGSPWPEIG
jgi:hypothetical protein